MIGTDAMVADAIARETGRRADLLVAPLFSIGVAEHHMAFPGTLSLRPSTLIALLLDTLHSLAHHGFRRFFFINGHGGNIATLKAAFSEIHAGQRGQGGGSGTRLRPGQLVRGGGRGASTQAVLRRPRGAPRHAE